MYRGRYRIFLGLKVKSTDSFIKLVKRYPKTIDLSSKNYTEEEIEFQLRGNTLKVYWYLLMRNSPVGVRETAKTLRFSSPSIAAHHLSRLVDLGLVEKGADNRYELHKTVKVGVLRHFIEIRGKLLPRYFFVAIFFTTAVLLYGILTLLLPVPGTVDRVLFFIFCAIGAIFGWLETLRLYNLRVFKPD